MRLPVKYNLNSLTLHVRYECNERLGSIPSFTEAHTQYEITASDD